MTDAEKELGVLAMGQLRATSAVKRQWQSTNASDGIFSVEMRESSCHFTRYC